MSRFRQPPRAPVLAPAAQRGAAAGDEGAMLVWALLFAIISSAMIVSHSTYMAANRREMQVRYENADLADTFARSGLTDALAWYQRQPTQPVTQFAPKLEPNGDPPLLETLDPTVGLVREFEVRGNLWARYEVRHEELADISSERGQATQGVVWDVGSRGYLYELADPSRPFDKAPNRVVASTYVRTEMRGIAIVPPAPAAVVTDNPADIDIGPNAVIDGGGQPALAYPAGTLPAALPVTVTGTPVSVPVVQLATESDDVFSMGLTQLRTLSDYVVGAREASAGASGGSGGDGFHGGQNPGCGNSGSGNGQGENGNGQGENEQGSLSGSVVGFSWQWQQWWSSGTSGTSFGSNSTPTWFWTWQRRGYTSGTGQIARKEEKRELRRKVVFVDGDLVLDSNRPLKGKALLVIDGNLVVREDNNSALKGVIYVAGDCDIQGDFRLEGMLIVKGKLRLGHGSQPVVIQYDQGALDTLKKAVERYRLSRSIRPGWSR